MGDLAVADDCADALLGHPACDHPGQPGARTLPHPQSFLCVCEVLVGVVERGTQTAAVEHQRGVGCREDGEGYQEVNHLDFFLGGSFGRGGASGTLARWV